jgi:putative nucleotidyltransferase with HDIG domain
MVFLFDSFVTSSFDIGNYPSLIMGFSAGLLATFCMDTVHSRLKLFARSLIVSIPALLSVGMNIIEHGSASFDIGVALACAASSGPLSAIIFSVLLPIFETLFKKVSYFKYSELTDHKAPVIRKLIKYAPGTFNHAVVVSNIAEACAAAIEEDSLLARTCAYYHDIGKLRRPEFFTENQSETGNPHDDLTPELSANIIKSHAMDGAALAEKHRLPKEIADVCREHHGTLPIAYFYDKAKKFTDGEVDISQFRYPGPKPKSKIAAIIMIADACEAAARALKDRSRENVTKKVREIVNERMSLGQFDDCEITLKELNIIIHTVVNNLSGVYHSRIEYPKVSFDGIE